MAYKHIIWDWNGTLLDDTWLCVEVINQIMALREMPPVNIDSYRAEFGFPVIEYYHKLGFDLEHDPFEEISVEFISEYNRRRMECHLYPEALPMVEEVTRRGIDQVILSAHPQEMLEDIVALFGMDKYFSKLIGHSDIYANGKADNGRAHMASLAHAPHEVLLIGDTLHDFEVAEAIGADCVLLEQGHQDRRRLEKAGVPVLDSHEKLLHALESSTA